ncbi:ribonuclease HII [Tumebacillus algifaecis]|uniref:Ribonuclease HII n=1 Tax=Tumebacillus algifaecis TaxID=1214604 RepID=A0A223D1Z6_9BACL|nr:ribonuclease HII [Tumebacillus algifaecis]ASS75678.1 ribonuclease HII [Tumebacillus algifaecis]
MKSKLDFGAWTVGEIRDWLQGTVPNSRQEQQLRTDSRSGVRKLIESYVREREKAAAYAAWRDGMWKYERAAKQQGYHAVAGIDEAGRGPLAGPVVAAAVILPPGIELQGLNDSKQVAEETRNQLFDLICTKSVAYGIGVVDTEYIDKHNILQGTFEAARRALRQMEQQFDRVPDYLLTDYLKIPGVALPYQAIVKGDANSFSIAAASILAKVTRDRCMEAYGKEYPQYGFERHKGYSSPEHMQALEMHGPCPIHRTSFAPVQKLLQGTLFDFADL